MNPRGAVPLALTSRRKLTPMDMEKIISHAILVPLGNGRADSGPSDPDCLWGLNLCWWGLPGIGKSARIKVGAHAVGLPAFVIMPSHHQPEDFSGVPVMRADGREITIECILVAVRKLLALEPHPVFGPRGLLFVDEVNWARPAVQGALLGAVQDRVFGGIALPPGIRIQLAANPPAIAGGGWEMIPPLANRMGHLELPPPTPEEWSDWLMGRTAQGLVGLESGEERVRAYWPDVFARAKGIMTGFMRHLGSKHIHNLPAEGHVDRGRAWPSPRGWEMATRALATCLALDPSTDLAEITVGSTEAPPEDDPELDRDDNRKKREEWEREKEKQTKVLQTTAANQMAHTLIEAIVGHAAASDWITWLVDADLPDPEDVLDRGWKIDDRRIDRTVAVIDAVTAFVLGQRTVEEKVRRAAQLWPFVGRLIDAGLSDLARIVAEDLSTHTPKLDSTHSDLAAVAAPVTLRLGRGIMQLGRRR